MRLNTEGLLKFGTLKRIRHEEARNVAKHPVVFILHVDHGCDWYGKRPTVHTAFSLPHLELILAHRKKTLFPFVSFFKTPHHAMKWLVALDNCDDLRALR